MNDQIEMELTKGALLKWLMGENMSASDLKRIMNVIATKPLSIEKLDDGEIMGLMGQFKSLVAQRFAIGK
jgi:hypothetical protein